MTPHSINTRLALLNLFPLFRVSRLPPPPSLHTPSASSFTSSLLFSSPRQRGQRPSPVSTSLPSPLRCHSSSPLSLTARLRLLCERYYSIALHLDNRQPPQHLQLVRSRMEKRGWGGGVWGGGADKCY